MIPDIYEVTRVGDGALYVMPRPQSEWLEDDIRHFASMGVDLVISHLEKAEEAELGLAQEEALLNKANIAFESFPIKDRNLPAKNNYGNFIEDIYQQLSTGKNIAIHCRAGIGRTGLSASCLLICDGYSAEAAMDMVSAARGVQIPDTEEQFDFICDFMPNKSLNTDE